MKDIYDFKDPHGTVDFYEEEINNDYVNRVEGYANNLKEDYICGKEQYNIASKPKQSLFPVRPVEYPNRDVMVGWPKLWQESWQEMIDNKNNQNTGYDNKVLKDIITKRWGKDAFPKKENFSKNKTIQLLSEKKKEFEKKQVLNKALENNKKLSECIDCVSEIMADDCCTNCCSSIDGTGLLYELTIYSNYPLNISYDVERNAIQVCGNCTNEVQEYSLDDLDVEDFYTDLKDELSYDEDLSNGYCEDMISEEW